MSSFIKSIFGMFTSAKSTETKKCPDYFHTIHVNDNLRPNNAEGLSVTFDEKISSSFGNINIWTNRKTTNSVGSTSLQISMWRAFNNNQAINSETTTVQTFVDADLKERVVAQAQLRVPDLVSVDVCNQEGKIREMNTMANWSGSQFNTSALLSVKTAVDDGKPRNTLAVECVHQFGDRWRIGGSVAVDVATGNERWRSSAFRCSGALRYDNKANTFMVTADQAATGYFQYQHRVDHSLALAVEMTADLRNNEHSMTHNIRKKFGDGMDIRGQMDSNGMVIAELRKAFPQKMVSVGVSALRNFKTHKNTVGVGLNFG